MTSGVRARAGSAALGRDLEPGRVLFSSVGVADAPRLGRFFGRAGPLLRSARLTLERQEPRRGTGIDSCGPAWHAERFGSVDIHHRIGVLDDRLELDAILDVPKAVDPTSRGRVGWNVVLEPRIARSLLTHRAAFLVRVRDSDGDPGEARFERAYAGEHLA